jgi:hypothetical protein
MEAHGGEEESKKLALASASIKMAVSACTYVQACTRTAVPPVCWTTQLSSWQLFVRKGASLTCAPTHPTRCNGENNEMILKEIMIKRQEVQKSELINPVMLTQIIGLA